MLTKRFKSKILTFIMGMIISTAVFSGEPLIIVTELSPPYQTLEQNHIGGLATEKVRKLMKKAQLPYEIHMYPWARAFRLAKTTPNTLIYAIAKTPERAQYFEWLIKVYEFRPYLVGKKSAAVKLTDIQQARQYTIAVQRNDFAHDYLLSEGFEEGINLIVTNSIVDSWHLLNNDKVNFVVEDFDYDPTNINSKEQSYSRYLPLKALWQSTFLAANKDMDKDVLTKLKNEIE